MSVGATAVTVEEPQRSRCDRERRRDLRRHVRWRFRRRAGARASRGCAACCGPPSRSSARCATSSRPTAIDHVLGRKDFESPPRAWEVLMVARRLARRRRRRRSSAFLDWGFTAIDLDVRTTHDRDAAVAADPGVRRRAAACPSASPRCSASSAHELLMNAMYDAPVDAHGRPKYAGDRKADIQLADDERPTRARRRPTARGSCSRFAIRSAGSSAGTCSTGSRAGSPAARWISHTAGRAGHDGVPQRVVGDVLRRRARAGTPRSPRCSSST